jgi:hypothetical protein
MELLGLRRAAVLGLSLLFLIPPIAPSRAASSIEINYAITYLHVTIGTGRWLFDTSGNSYTTLVSGEVKGMMSLLINGKGYGSVEGVIAGSDSRPSSFAAHVVSTAENDNIEIAFQDGAVKTLYAFPPFPPNPKRVPISAAALSDVTDPLSASIAFMGAPNGPASLPCDRRLRIFDGRRRFDVALSYQRTESLAVPPAFRGMAIVCSAQLFPIAGQEVKSSALKYLVESNGLQVKYVAVPEARVFIPIAGTLPTLIGNVHVNATSLAIANRNPKE